MDDILIYTDGGCHGNPGPGGWACVIVDEDEKRSLNGGDPATTNNRMELTAVIRALETVKPVCEARGIGVELHTDSQYVKNGITTWIHSWVRNGWKTAAKKPVKNQDLWQQLKALDDQVRVSWRWVRGHSGVSLNEECDQLVQDAIHNLNR